MKEFVGDAVSREADLNVQAGGFPEQIVPDGLSVDRQKYLYSEIRQFCRPGTKDLVCPIPEDPDVANDARLLRGKKSDNYNVVGLDCLVSFSL